LWSYHLISRRFTSTEEAGIFFPNPIPFSVVPLPHTISLGPLQHLAWPDGGDKKFFGFRPDLPLPLANFRRMHLKLRGYFIGRFLAFHCFQCDLGLKVGTMPNPFLPLDACSI
jgi:hypothetical protein